MNNPKIAFVKSSLYWDLWVCDKTNNYFDILKTSMLRTPPIALAEHFKTDFIIIKELFDKPKSFYDETTPGILNFKNSLLYNIDNKNPTLPFLDTTYNNITIDSLAYDVNSIDWNKYNIVIALNICIPEYIIEKYPNILWCYMIGENHGKYINTLYNKYNLILNQDFNINSPIGIFFPYTYLHPYTLENINKNILHNINNKNGIYIEINNTEERPVNTIPSEILFISQETNLPIYKHNQNIIENIKNMYQSKYFLKLQGRYLRGNSVLEAVSNGCVLVANPTLISYNNLIHPSCYIYNKDDAVKIINLLEKNNDEYNKIIFILTLS
jgi:hypothetical protein